jgi:hypothetical protein
MAEKKTIAENTPPQNDDGKVTVYIPKEPGVKEQLPVYVNANGRTALIKRGEYVRVHPSIAEVLQESDRLREVADDYYTRVSE